MILFFKKKKNTAIKGRTCLASGDIDGELLFRTWTQIRDAVDRLDTKRIVGVGKQAGHEHFCRVEAKLPRCEVDSASTWATLPAFWCTLPAVHVVSKVTAATAVLWRTPLQRNRCVI